MPLQLETAAEFAATLAEVDLLLAESDNAGPGSPNANEQRVAVMNKVALLLLMGKFEAFMETAVEDFVDALNGIRAKRRHLPERVLVEHSLRSIQEVESKLKKGTLKIADLTYVCSVFESLANSWSDSDPCVDLKISSKFNYGKHGAKEVEKLYGRLGLDDLFVCIAVEDGGEVYDGAVPKIVDIPGLIDSLTNIRNNILHQDATPQLTVVSLRKHSGALKAFAVKLVATLQQIVDDIENASIAEGAARAV